MESLERQVRRAHRRLGMQRFARALGRCWLVTFLVALILIAVDRFYPMSLAVWSWSTDTNTAGLSASHQQEVALAAAGSLALGALVLGLLAAGVWIFVTRRPALGAAIEIDHRFGLKERVSSTLAMEPEDRQTEAGRALIDDAVRRVGRIDVAGGFSVRPGKPILLPLLPGLAAVLLALLIDAAVFEKPAIAKTDAAKVRARIKVSSAELAKRLTKSGEEAEEKGLKEARELFDRLQRGTRQLGNKATDRKKALNELNDLADQVKERRKQLGGSEKMRQQLDRLKNIDRGPAQQFAKAIARGDFKEAAEKLEEMKDKLEGGDLDEQQKKELADQLDKMKDKIQKAADAQQAAREDLEQRIEELCENGQTGEADKLQNQLDKLMDQPQIDGLNDLASQLGDCAQAMQDGQLQDATDSLSQLQSGLEGLAQNLEEMDMLDEAMQQISQARDRMNCDKCGGGGCKACNGGGQGMARGMGGQGGKGPGDGLGEGQGRGDRPEEQTETATIDSQYQPNVGKGTGMIIGELDGPNLKGRVEEIIQEQYDTARRGSTDPLENRRIPREHRRHVQEYLDRFREGE